MLAETDGFVEFGKDYKNKRRVIVKPKTDKLDPIEYLIPKGKHISVREGDYVEKGDYIVEGNPSPHDILRIKGVEELAIYLVKEIQDVYRLQGVKINDKHIEVIVPPDDAEDGNQRRRRHHAAGRRTGRSAGAGRGEQEGRRSRAASPPRAARFCSASPRPRLQTRSVFSAASFQETTRVLTDAAVNGKVDTLEGLKENVIVGRLIPAGTGGAIARLRHIAAERDKAIQAERAAARRPRRRWKRPPRPRNKKARTAISPRGWGDGGGLRLLRRFAEPFGALLAFPHRRHKSPRARANAPCVPRSTITPSSSTRISSASTTVDSRCAMISVVRRADSSFRLA